MDDKIKKYDVGLYKRFTGKQNLDKAVHMLEGLLKGISIDDDISVVESKAIEDWLNKNSMFLSFPPLNDLIYILEGVCKYNKLGKDDKENIIYICQNFHEKNNFYNDTTADIQVLHGILHGVLVDEKITITELKKLQQWLDEYGSLEGTYPYDEIKAIIYSILENNSISKKEEELLKAYFSQFVDLDIKIDEEMWNSLNKLGVCSVNPKINIKNSIFCFTGKSSRCKRKEISEIIENYGGVFKDTVVVDTDYLIVGNEGNPDWAYACYGKKIERAIKLRKEGHNIQLINELDFWKLIDSNSSKIEKTDFWNEDSVRIHSTMEQVAKQTKLSTLKIVNVNSATFSANIIDEDGFEYDTTLQKCSCDDFKYDHLPCRHMYALANKLKKFKSSREIRSKKLIVDCSTGYSKDWFFVVQPANYLALDILLTPRKENKKNVMVLTQGKFYNFNEGSIFYDTDKAYKLSWKDALKEIKYSIQITKSTSNMTINDFKYIDNCIKRNTTIIYGEVTFNLYKVTKEKNIEDVIGSFTCKQDEFVKFLKTGVLNKNLDLNKIY